MTDDDSPPMPEWAPPDGPWCLRQWIPLCVSHPRIDVCLLAPEHGGDCRGIHGAWHNRTRSIACGQLEAP